MPIPDGVRMEVGVRDERVPLLRERLRQTGDLSIDPEGDPLVFDAALSRAVLRFQERTRVSRESSLVEDDDGLVGEETMASLNVPVAVRIQQLRANLERCRWLLRDLPATYVLVDMAGYRGYFYKDDEIIWRARVQIGTPYNETPSFRSTIKYIVFNPTWTVPPGIMRDVTLPRIRKDLTYLEKNHLQVFDRDGRRVDPATVDWAGYTANTLPYRIVQTPGPHNAVGRVKFIFPNPYYIYLHDTPHKTEFGLDERAYSAGCIRIDKPYKLAKRLLNGGPEKWTIGRIWDIIDAGKTVSVFLPTPVPVLITYLTAQVDDQGQVHFRKDIYKRDAALLQSLDAAATTP
jgi:murein L,D-transpeptidase YcbB/YkuD